MDTLKQKTYTAPRWGIKITDALLQKCINVMKVYAGSIKKRQYKISKIHTCTNAKMDSVFLHKSERDNK